MFCSTIIATIGRDTLARSVNSVLTQKFSEDDFEVIVVNDTGAPLPPADWQQSPCVRIITTNKRERCVARNAGAAIAKGRYFHFLDDDDWLLPEAYQIYWELAQQYPRAAWLYGSSRLVDRQDNFLTDIHPTLKGNCFTQVMAGEWITLGASFIKSEDFMAIGGFHPLVLVTQDIDLCRRIAFRGDLAGSAEVVACFRMGIGGGSSTNYDRASRYSRWAREQILNESGVWQRMRDSATSSYWYGRIVRAYLTSAVWNVQHRHGFTAASRALYGLGSMVTAKSHLFSSRFWRAIASKHESESFERA